jgi:hypothetical protein
MKYKIVTPRVLQSPTHRSDEEAAASNIETACLHDHAIAFPRDLLYMITQISSRWIAGGSTVAAGKTLTSERPRSDITKEGMHAR